MSGSGFTGGSFTLRLGASGQVSSALPLASTGTTIANALMGLQYNSGYATIGDVRVTRTASQTDSGFTLLVTFVSNYGALTNLIADVSGITPPNAANATVTKFITGFANSFTVEPRKPNGELVTDLDFAPAFVGSQVFLPELWTSDVSVVDGTHTWSVDGTVAEYIPKQYAVQVVATTLTTANAVGTFTLSLDTSRIGCVRVRGIVLVYLMVC